MAYYYGSLAVLGWIWTALILVAVAIWRATANRRREGEVTNSNEHKH